MYYRFANLFIITYLLLGCSSYKTAGFIIPQNNKYIEEYASDGNSWYWAQIPLEISEAIVSTRELWTVYSRFIGKIIMLKQTLHRNML